ncbi:N amino acid transport system protein [Wickerhamiella sorbophila]|uniref:N amino acid transport system protein n=1 Tax=Wickerhamiella sorbophila TaxID=45607 RepID=A0A2T0FKZ8_9ASCO|nr:N amino acid transport system protein [Wickerhamiella sorbophila]PRT55647.1 N amino acid transport system protein [Wickerhamiella sorbophila]
MSLVPISSFSGALAPKVSKQIFEESSDGDDEKNVYEHSDEVEYHDTNKLPLQVYTHYAEIQRSYEEDNRLDELYEAQELQRKTDPHANLTTAKLESQRQLRAAKIYSVFFLITTDILGPSNAPYAIAQMGYVPGVILYVLFGCMAAFGGYLLNRAFCRLDSNNYPIRTFSDLAARCIGYWFRYPFAILQFIQMIMNVGLILLGTATAVAEVIVQYHGHNTFCFVVNILVWALFGMLLGQIKTLHRFAHIANSAVWMNIAICIITMVAAATTTPYYSIFWANYGHDYPYNTTDILRYAITPGTLSTRIAGMNNMVFAWGGATIFCEVMAELKRPMDFWKGMICGQALILVVYLFFGLFVYSYWGQWSYVTANLGIAKQGLQVAGNILSIISGLLAAVLYGNVGIKVLYQGFLVADFNFPKLTTKKGTIYWAIAVVIYWAVAFIIGTAIPSISALVGIIGAFCIFNFSYTFPFMFNFVLMVREDAGRGDTFDIQTITVTRGDTWRNASRWKRGLFYGGTYRSMVKLAFFLLTLASLATCGLCSYSAIEQAIAVYQTNVATSFGCSANV